MGCKVLFAVAALFSVISLGTALKCFACAGTATSDCAQGKKSSMVIQDCAHKNLAKHGVSENSNEDEDSAKDLKEVCLKIIQPDFKPKLYARGCGLVPANVTDACDYIEDLIHLDACKACTTDLCNLRIEPNDLQ